LVFSLYMTIAVVSQGHFFSLKTTFKKLFYKCGLV